MVPSKIIKTRACMNEDLSSCYSPVFPMGSGKSHEPNPPTSIYYQQTSHGRGSSFVVFFLICESDHAIPIFKTFQ